MQYKITESREYERIIKAWLNVYNEEGRPIASTLVEFTGPYDPNKWVNEDYQITDFDKEYIRTLIDDPLTAVQLFVDQFNDEFEDYQAQGYFHLKKYEHELR